MELWIRSQDKESLVKLNGSIGYFYDDIENEHGIGSHGYTLGVYESKERALEVLTEIQRIIYPKEYINFNLKIKNKSKTEVIKDHYSSYLSSYVYEMPEK